MFTVLPFALSLKWTFPAVLMLGTAPNFICLWMSWRCASALMPKKWYHKGDDILYSMYQRYVLFFFENMLGLDVLLYGEAEEALKKKENVVFMCNHQSTVDWMVADFLAIRQGSLGHIRYILKDGLKYFPLYGFYFKMHGCIYVKRSGKFHKENAVRQHQALAKNDIPFWMVVFPEGTRYQPDLTKNIQKSQQFARDQGLQVLDNVLTPRNKAMKTCFDGLGDKIDAVYDVTVGYVNTTDKEGDRIAAPGLPEFLNGASPQIHVHLSRIPFSDIPKDEEKLKLWLHEKYVEKDRKLKEYFSRGSPSAGTFGKPTSVSQLSLKHTLPSFLFFTAFNAVMLGTETGRSVYWKTALFGTTGAVVWMAMFSDSC